MNAFDTPPGTVWLAKAGHDEHLFVVLDGYVTWPNEGTKLFRCCFDLLKGAENSFSKGCFIDQVAEPL